MEALLPVAFNVGFSFGSSFLINSIIAIVAGKIFQKPHISILIFIGMTLSNVFAQIQNEGIQQLLSGNLEGALVAGVMFCLLNWASKIQSGDY